MSESLHQSRSAANARDATPNTRTPDPGRTSRSSTLDGPRTNPVDSGLGGTDKDDQSLAEDKTFATIDGEAFLHGISPSDVEQGALGDCWLVGALQALAISKPELIRNMITTLGPGRWAVTFHFPTLTGAFEKEVVHVNASVPVDSAGTPIYARTGNDRDGKKRELWVLLIEKAYAKTQQKYANTIGLDGTTRGYGAMEMVTGKRNGEIDPTGDPDRLLNELDLALRFARKAVTLGTVGKKHPNAEIAAKYQPEINRNHTYALNGVDKPARTVDLLNPHGKKHLDAVPIDIVQKVVDQILTSGE